MKTCSKTNVFSRNTDFPWHMANQIHWIFLEPQPPILGGFGCCQNNHSKKQTDMPKKCVNMSRSLW